MSDESILDRISELIERERVLRAGRAEGTVDKDTELRELREAEVALDRCWDLLRQRRAKREFGEEAEDAQVRAAEVVEKYLE
jgi:hypothetical protein